jgi:hypothetical protein
MSRTDPVSYAQRARRFLTEGSSSSATIESADERNEGNEETLDAVKAEPIPVWWNDRVPAGSSAIRYLPPRGCRGPQVCSRIGPCDRHRAGAPCEVAR